MIWLAISIFVCTVLYLVDKNAKWRTFWKLGFTVGIVAVVLALGFGAYLYWSDLQSVRMIACAQQIRRDYPGDYDDLSDPVLTSKVEARYPGYCSSPQVRVAAHLSDMIRPEVKWEDAATKITPPAGFEIEKPKGAKHGNQK